MRKLYSVLIEDRQTISNRGAAFSGLVRYEQMFIQSMNSFHDLLLVPVAPLVASLPPARFGLFKAVFRDFMRATAELAKGDNMLHVSTVVSSLSGVLTVHCGAATD